MFGICNLSNIPLRAESSDTSEIVSQVLFGEHFEILENQKNWLKIKLAFDDYEGWIDEKQIQLIEKFDFEKLNALEYVLNADLVQYIANESIFMPILLGSSLGFLENKVINIENYQFEGTLSNSIQSKSNLINTAFLYLNAPYLWGGKTPFGIDCSGFTQMVYKLNGYKLLRDAKQQANQGEPLSFIEESEPGDLAFFDNEEGNIIHVGIIMQDNYIIHASGKVRIDRLDHSGIFNEKLNKHTHKLRVIKKII